MGLENGAKAAASIPKPLAGYAELSDVACYYIGGLLQYAPAVLALANLTVNSCRRLYSCFEAPVNPGAFPV